MCKQYKINDYLRSRIESIALELKLIFKEERRTQSSMMEFISG
jgi:DNA polymerase II large subunit